MIQADLTPKNVIVAMNFLPFIENNQYLPYKY